MDDDERRAVRSVLLKGGALLLGICVIVALGTFVMVRALGLNDSGSDTTTAQVQPNPEAPLPSTALPVPKQQDQQTGDDEPTHASSADKNGDKAGGKHRKHSKKAGFKLSASPVAVNPMQRINLTGRYRGHDNVQLQVQRLEHGIWTDFPTEANVSMGTFQTYVMTGHSGVNKFRMYDPAADRSSNVVKVRVG